MCSATTAAIAPIKTIMQAGVTEHPRGVSPPMNALTWRKMIKQFGRSASIGNTEGRHRQKLTDKDIALPVSGSGLHPQRLPKPSSWGHHAALASHRHDMGDHGLEKTPAAGSTPARRHRPL